MLANSGFRSCVDRSGKLIALPLDDHTFLRLELDVSEHVVLDTSLH